MTCWHASPRSSPKSPASRRWSNTARRCCAAASICLVISVGALADPALLDAAQIGRARRRRAASCCPPAQSAASMRSRRCKVAGLTSVRYRSRKPPAAWRGSPAEQVVDLGTLTQRTVLYKGTRRRSRIAVSAERQCRGRGRARGARLRRDRSRARRRSRCARQRARDRGRRRRRAICHPAAGQAVAQQSQDLGARRHERRASVCSTQHATIVI